MAKGEFLSDWLGTPRKKDPSKLSRRVIKHDRWDSEDFDALLKAMPDFDASRDRLCDTVDTGNGLWADTFFSFFKVEPEQIGAGDVRPDYQINRFVNNEMRGLTEYEELRSLGTVGDDINAALACVTVRPDLETLFDKLKKEQELAKQLQERMQKLAQAQQEAQSIDEIIDALHQDCTCVWHPLSEGPPPEQPPAGYVEPPEDECGDRYYYPDQPQGEPGGDPGEPPRHQPPSKESEAAKAGLQSQQQAMAKTLEEAQAQADAAAQEFQDAMDKAGSQIRSSLQKGLEKAVDEAKDMQSSAEAWGLDPGVLHRLPADERIALAKRINSPRLKKIAELFGPMRRLMFTEQRRKVNHARDEVYDISKGNELARVLPMQFAPLDDPLTEILFFKDFFEGNLLQYEMRGEERVGKGGIIYVEDGSGSMSGAPEMWAKALGLCLLNLARQQKRSFKAIHFGSANQIAEIDFSKPEDHTLEKTLEFAELFFGGGTNFQTPLSRALSHLQNEFDVEGCVKGDIVFATDGSCGVNDEWFKEFKAEQERIGFTVWGVNIGGRYADEPLNKLCDGKVSTIRDLVSGEDVRNIFGGINEAA